MKSASLIPTLFFLTLFAACTAQPAQKEDASTANSSDKIEAYYFHFTARCVTCNTIEAKTKENLETLYPQHFKSGLITFKSVNLDESASKPLVQKLGIGGQTLLLVKGDQKINLTNEGFMYAVVKPEKFKEVINEKVEFLLSR